MSAEALSNAALVHEVRAILDAHSSDLSAVTPRVVRTELEQRLGYDENSLESRRKEIKAAIEQLLPEFNEDIAIKAEPPVASTTAPTIVLQPIQPASASQRTAADQRALNAQKKRALAASADESNSDDEDNGGSAKKKQKRFEKPPAGSSSVVSHSPTGAGSDPNTVSLGSSKRVEVREFNRMLLIDIRETYVDKTSGETRPGKKGISLKVDQWETLLKNAAKINAAIARMQK